MSASKYIGPAQMDSESEDEQEQEHHTSLTSSPSAGKRVATKRKLQQHEEVISQLIGMGYKKSAVELAVLQEGHSDINSAMSFLTEHPTGRRVQPKRGTDAAAAASVVHSSKKRRTTNTTSKSSAKKTATKATKATKPSIKKTTAKPKSITKKAATAKKATKTKSSTASKATSKTKTKPPTDPNKPKRSKSAYLYFSSEQRATIVTNNPDVKNNGIMALVGAEWKKLTEEQKIPYETQAKIDKERYNKEMKNYQPPANAGASSSSSSSLIKKTTKTTKATKATKTTKATKATKGSVRATDVPLAKRSKKSASKSKSASVFASERFQTLLTTFENNSSESEILTLYQVLEGVVNIATK